MQHVSWQISLSELTCGQYCRREQESSGRSEQATATGQSWTMLRSPDADGIRSDVSTVVGLGAVIHRPRRASDGTTWREAQQSTVGRDRRAGHGRESVGRRDALRGDRMTERSLQVTFRKGKAFSAYLFLSHQTGEKSAKTVASADGLLVIDYAKDGK